MVQTKAGAKKSVETIVKRFGVTEDGRSAMHVRAGALGGANSRDGAFAHNRELARLAGKIGGMRSRKDSKYTPTPEVEAEVAKIKARIAELKSL